MAAIYRKELKIYFSGAFGFVIISLLTLFAGAFTVIFNIGFMLADFGVALEPMKLVLILIAPLLAMRSIAAERHAHTDQLLFSLPIRTLDIVLGKLFAMLTVFLIPTLITALYPLLLSTMGSISLSAAYTALLGYFLMGACLIAFCAFLSSLMESQVMAVAVSIGACLALYFMDLLLSVIPASGLVSLLLLMATALLLGGLVWLYCRSLLVGAGAFLIFALPLTAVYLIKPILFKALFADFLYAINPFSGQTGFSYGYLDLGGVVFFLTVIALFAFLTVQSLESRRRA